MELEKLQEKSIDEGFLEILKIDFLDIMLEEDVTARKFSIKSFGIQNLKYEFLVNAASFTSTIKNFYSDVPVELKRELEYFKIYFIQDEKDIFSICFSISSKENQNNGPNDSFYTIDSNEELIKIDKFDFEKYKEKFRVNLLQVINIASKTENNTEIISYKLKDVYLFIIKHFLVMNKSDFPKLLFELIKFEKTVKEPNSRNKLSLVVRAESINKDKGDAYDFGTVYP